MKLVESMDQYVGLTTSCKKENGSTNINCYYFADDLRKHVSDRKLYYQPVEAGLAVYLKNDRFYQMYLYVNPEKKFSVEPADKPIVFEVLGVGEMPERIEKAVNSLYGCGFIHSTTTFRMVAEETGSFGEDSQNAPEYPVIMARPEHMPEIMGIWARSFDGVINRIPSAGELAGMIAEGNMICVVDESGRVLGVVQIGLEKGSAWMWHEAVLPEYRGKKIGHALTKAFFDWCAEKGISKKYLWVEKSNPSAIRFHAKAGFVAENKVCEQYILR